MDQLTLSFHEEFLLQLKATDWEFESRPENIEKSAPHRKFIQLDRSTSESKNGRPEKNSSPKNDK